MNELISDSAIYNELQKLDKFVEFIAGLEYSTEKDKVKAKEIQYLIKNIHKTETHKEWRVCLDILDYDLQSKNDREGFYQRTWSVFFESDILEITAESRNTSDDFGHYGDDFSFQSTFDFRKNNHPELIDLSGDIDEFVNDAMDYKKYITESLNNIEIDIDVWEDTIKLQFYDNQYSSKH